MSTPCSHMNRRRERTGKQETLDTSLSETGISSSLTFIHHHRENHHGGQSTPDDTPERIRDKALCSAGCEMSSSETPRFGSIIWTDLTIPNAEELRDFYAGVAGWTATPVRMGTYADYQMNAPATGESVAGICHARGVNAGLPPQWLMYISVEDIIRSAARCTELGGTILVPPRPMGSYGTFCVIRDPAGAVAALFQPAKTSS